MRRSHLFLLPSLFVVAGIVQAGAPEKVIYSSGTTKMTFNGKLYHVTGFDQTTGDRVDTYVPDFNAAVYVYTNVCGGERTIS